MREGPGLCFMVKAVSHCEESMSEDMQQDHEQGDLARGRASKRRSVVEERMLLLFS